MKTSWNGLNILQFIDYCMNQGMSEENAEICADIEFGLYDEREGI